MTLKIWLTMSCATLCAAGCDPLAPHSEPLFRDVQRPPPLERVETVDYLVTHDPVLAGWIEETARACDQYGCIGAP